MVARRQTSPNSPHPQGRRGVPCVVLLPSRIEVEAASGSAAVDLDPGAWDAAWADGLRPLDEPLRRALEQAGVSAGAAVRCVYHGPDVFVDLVSVPSAGARALEAARLAAREAAGGGARAESAIPLERLESPPRTKVLAFSDSLESLERVASWLARAGLRERGLVPGKAAGLLAAARAASRDASLPAEALVLVMGEQSSALAGRVKGELSFARCVDVGLGGFADALGRAVRASAGSPPDAQARGRLRQCIRTRGLPRAEDLIDERSLLTGDRALPYIQPVLQRLMLELKHTLRFNAEPEASGPVAIAVGGLAPAGLERLIASNLDARVGSDCRIEAWSNADAAEAVADAGAVLRSPSGRATRARSTRSRAVAAGAILALAGVGADYALTRKIYEQMASDLAAHLAPIEAERARWDRARAATAPARLAAQADEAIDRAVGRRPDWTATLRLVAGANAGLTLTRISAIDTPEKTTLQVDGIARPDASGHDPLAAYLEALRASPLLRDVELVSAHTAPGAGGPVRNFTVSAAAQRLPARGLERADAARPEGP